MQSIIFKDIPSKHTKYSFGLAKYGELTLIIEKSTGYINVAKLCSNNGKKFGDWLVNKGNKELLDTVDKEILLSRNLDSTTITILDLPKSLRGTYAHELLLPHIASWISKPFAILVSKVFNNWIIREYKESIREKNTEIDELKTMIKEMNEQSNKKLDTVINQNIETKEELLETKEILLVREEQLDIADEKLDDAFDKIDEVNCEVQKISEALEIKAERYVPNIETKGETFLLGKLITPKVFKGITYEYQVYRVRTAGRARALARNPSVIIFELPDIGNPRNLYDLIKTEMPEEFIFRVNSLHLNMRERRFVRHVKRVHNNRLN
jgi:hypothetical protein